jgi:hypothetical protein
MTEQPAPTGHIYGRKDFAWAEHPDGWALHAMGQRDAIVRIVPDGTRPGMWRIRHAGGRLSDMANLTWAKDGAIAVAMRLLDPRKRGEQHAHNSSPISEPDPAVTQVPDAPASPRAPHGGGPPTRLPPDVQPPGKGR